MDLPLLQEIRAESEAKGRAEGEAKGRLLSERDLCLELARKYHPAAQERMRLLIATCDDADRLRRAVLAAADVSSEEFCRILESS